MVIARLEFCVRLCKRLSYINIKSMVKNVNAMIDVLTQRMIDGKPIKIKGFGTFSRKRVVKKAFNVFRNEPTVIVSNSIKLFPDKGFLYALFADREFIGKILEKKSAMEIKNRIRKKRLV